jgi:hypothetical protein
MTCLMRLSWRRPQRTIFSAAAFMRFDSRTTDVHCGRFFSMSLHRSWPASHTAAFRCRCWPGAFDAASTLRLRLREVVGPGSLALRRSRHTACRRSRRNKRHRHRHPLGGHKPDRLDHSLLRGLRRQLARCPSPQRRRCHALATYSRLPSPFRCQRLGSAPK